MFKGNRRDQGSGNARKCGGTDEVHEGCDPPGSETDLCTLTRRNSRDAIISHPKQLKISADNGLGLAVVT